MFSFAIPGSPKRLVDELASNAPSPFVDLLVESMSTIPVIPALAPYSIEFCVLTRCICHLAVVCGRIMA